MSNNTPIIRQAPGMILSEGEIVAALKMNHEWVHYDESYSSLDKDSVLVLWFDGREDDEHDGSVRALRIKITSSLVGEPDEEDADDDAAKVFEATVLRRTGTREEIEEADTAMYGILFPDGSGVVMDTAPDSDYTNRLIMAQLAYEGVIE